MCKSAHQCICQTNYSQVQLLKYHCYNVEKEIYSSVFVKLVKPVARL